MESPRRRRRLPRPAARRHRPRILRRSSRSARQPTRLCIEAQADRSWEAAEQLDKVPLALCAPASRGEVDPRDERATLSGVDADEHVYMLAFQRKAPTVVEARLSLSPDEKRGLTEARAEVLEVFNRNDGWGPVSEEEVDPFGLLSSALPAQLEAEGWPEGGRREGAVPKVQASRRGRGAAEQGGADA